MLLYSLAVPGECSKEKREALDLYLFPSSVQVFCFAERRLGMYCKVMAEAEETSYQGERQGHTALPLLPPPPSFLLLPPLRRKT